MVTSFLDHFMVILFVNINKNLCFLWFLVCLYMWLSYIFQYYQFLLYFLLFSTLDELWDISRSPSLL